MSKSSSTEPLLTIGWREWVALPALGLAAIKAKVDTGARSSSLHAFDVDVFERHGKWIVRFKVHPLQRSTRETVAGEAELLEFREVKSSTGHATRRPVVITQLDLFGRRWPIELTLASRDEMGFRMLLGREAVRGRFLVDPGRSFCGGRPRIRDEGEPRPATGPKARRKRPG